MKKQEFEILMLQSMHYNGLLKGADGVKLNTIVDSSLFKEWIPKISKHCREILPNIFLGHIKGGFEPILSICSTVPSKPSLYFKGCVCGP